MLKLPRFNYEKLPLPTPKALAREFLLRRLPFWMIALVIISVTASWVPLVFLFRERVMYSEKPRIHAFQDMDNQPRFNAQSTNPMFADLRGMRGQIPGTIARGRLIEDEHYALGFSIVPAGQTIPGAVSVAPATPEGETPPAYDVLYYEGYPAGITVDDELLRRGRERFMIYCHQCHGADGYGGGPSIKRAAELRTIWQPTSFHVDSVIDRPNGHLYNTIRNGIRTMQGYGSQIDVEDRWAIVAYIRALQLSQNATRDDLPRDQLDKLP